MSDTKLNKPTAAAARQSSTLENDWNDMKDSFIQDDNWTQSFFQQESKTKTTKKPESSPKTFKKSANKIEDTQKGKTPAKTRAKQDIQTNKAPHDSDGWGLDDWAPLEDSAPVATSPSSAVPADKGSSGAAGDSWDTEGWDDFDNFEGSKQSSADIARKKREEKRKQRERALKEKRAAKGGSKLGAVKKD